jgi:hypothetical protein
MKKLFAVLALVGVMTSCKDKKKEEKKPEETTTTTPPSTETTPPAETTPTASVPGVPTFSDPEVQKFANEYGAFMAEYKNGMKDPAKMAELSKTMQEWSGKAQKIGMKLASTPDEAKKWADWAMAMAKDMMPATPK